MAVGNTDCISKSHNVRNPSDFLWIGKGLAMGIEKEITDQRSEPLYQLIQFLLYREDKKQRKTMQYGPHYQIYMQTQF